MGAVLSFSASLTTETCYSCGMQFAMPSDWNKKLLENKGTGFYCPAGHKQWYAGETEAQKLQKELDAQKQRTKWAEESRDRAQVNRQRAERKASAFKAVATKIKKRAGNGVCPCCNRTFQNLMNHMKTKHPTFKVKEK